MKFIFFSRSVINHFNSDLQIEIYTPRRKKNEQGQIEIDGLVNS